MISSKILKQVVTEARPVIERMLDDADFITGLREVVAANGGDWGSLKALIKAQIQDERDEAGDGKRVRKILDKADYSAAYADMLGLANMNEKNISSAEPHDPETGEIIESPANAGLDAKLVERVAQAVQTPEGQAALLVAVDTMIAREDDIPAFLDRRKKPPPEHVS